MSPYVRRVRELLQRYRELDRQNADDRDQIMQIEAEAFACGWYYLLGDDPADVADDELGRWGTNFKCVA